MKKKYTKSEMDRIMVEISEASMHGDSPTWQKVYLKYASMPVTVEMPLGELTNPFIVGYILGAKISGKLSYPYPIISGDRFDVQGIQSKFKMFTNMMTASLIYKDVSPYRIQIKKGHN